MRFLSRLMAILACTLSVNALAASSPSPAEVFGQLPMYKSVQISFDGKRIAYLQKLDGKYVLVNRSLEDDSAPNVYSLAEGNIREFLWVSNDRLLVGMTVPFYAKGNRKLFTLSRTGLLDAESNEMLWPFSNSKFVNFVNGPWLVHRVPDDPQHILMAAYADEPGEITTGSRTSKETTITYRGLYQVDINNGDIRAIEESRRTSSRWLANNAGEVLLKYQYHSEAKEDIWWYRDNAEDDFSPLTRLEAGEDAYFSESILGTDAALKSLYIAETGDGGREQIVRVSIDQGKVVEPRIVNRDDTYDVDSVIIDQRTQSVVGTYHIEDRAVYRYLDREFAQVQANLEATFPDATVDLLSLTDDFSRIIVAVTSPSTPRTYYLYDRKAGSIAAVANAWPNVTPELLSPVKRFDYAAADGLPIHGYLTIPTGQEDGQAPPLVLLPHGGPNARDSAEFDWMRQYFASRGYAVFQPNFRGSTGYGSEFEDAGLREWGGKMQSDLDDGVQALIDAGLVDPDKICAVGASYGGYAALMGVITRPERYRCAVAFAPVSNLGSMYNHVRDSFGDTDYWVKSIGSRFEDDHHKSLSPAFLVTRETPPVLLFHGDKDTVVPYEQSLFLSRNLKKAGNREGRLEVFDGEDHWLSLESSRQTFLRESGEFLEEHIGAD
ncbi:alpha/beta hydrolase family protein [Parahaliea aestuarii]|nr:alpha/beta fold hydrolase [Parahaliea aestuarii]